MIEVQARAKIDQLMRDMDLTLGEQVRVLSRLLSDAGKYIVRYERHGDCSTPADEAPDPTPTEEES